MLIELEISHVAKSNNDQNSLVLLKEKGGTRLFPIMTSQRRAMVIFARAKITPPTTLPISVADVCKMMMEQFNVNIRYVRLTNVFDGKCFCTVVGESDGVDHVVNFCQAGDGLIIAVTFKCPIFIDDLLMDLQYMRQVDGGGFSMNINTLTRDMLNDAMQQAIKEENYEMASALRDELRRREASHDPKFDINLDSLIEGDDSDDSSSNDK